MSRDTLLHEHEDHFIVHDGRTHLKVAKLGLNEGTLARIRRLPRAQHFDEGGVVPEPDLIALASPSVPATEADAMTPLDIGAPPVETSELAQPEPAAPAMRADLGGVPPKLSSEDQIAADDLAHAAAYKNLEIPTPFGTVTLNNDPHADLSNAAGFTPNAPPAGTRIAPSDAEQAQVDAMAARRAGQEVPAAPTATPTPFRAYTVPGGTSASLAVKTSRPGATPAIPNVATDNSAVEDFDKQVKDFGVAHEQTARLLAEHAKVTAQIQEDGDKILAAKAADYDARIAANQQHQEDIIHGRNPTGVDPSQWWDSRTTGQKLSAYASMIAGGIASAFGGQNLGEKIIGKAIADDLRAQEIDLANRRTDRKGLLAFYVDQGNSLESARARALADAKDHAARLITISATRFGGLMANPQAAEEVAKLGMSAARDRSAVAKAATEAKYAPATAALELKKTASEIAKNYAQRDEARIAGAARLAGGAGGAGGSGSQDIANPINLPNGEVIPGNDAAQAKEANEAMAGIQVAGSIAKRIRDLGATGYGTKAATEAAVLAGQLLPSLERIQLKGSRNRAAMEAVIQQVHAANAGGWRQDRTKAALDAIDQFLDDTQRSTVAAYGKRVPKAG